MDNLSPDEVKSLKQLAKLSQTFNAYVTMGMSTGKAWEKALYDCSMQRFNEHLKEIRDVQQGGR